MAAVKSLCLPNLKASQLKHLAFLTGLPSAGTKPELEKNLIEHITSFRPRTRPTRIVSVDMGIRNLAFCTIESPPTLGNSTTLKTPHPQPLKVLQWQRSDLLLPSTALSPSASSLSESSNPENDSPLPSSSKKPSKPKPDPKAFHPSPLSQLAHRVTTSLLLPPQPSTILIERQRFRTRGPAAAAIAEWTVRVNMLESMLWACLTTLRESGDARMKGGSTETEDVQVRAVTPDRVAAFWAAGWEGMLGVADVLGGLRGHGDGGDVNGSSGGTLGKRKLEKKDRVAIVREWAQGGGSDVPMTFEGQANETAEAFRSKKARSADGGKLDDLADCLLQAVAWSRWEENRGAIREMLQRNLESENG